MKIKFYSFLVFIIYSFCVVAKKEETLPIPRFVSIKFNEVNARTGPGPKFPIEWIFIKKGEPVELVREYEQWREIKDIHGQGGWVQMNGLSGKRFVIILGNELMPLYKNPDEKSIIVAKVAPEVRCLLKNSKQNWHQLQCQDAKGWTKRNKLYGMYLSEKL